MTTIYYSQPPSIRTRTEPKDLYELANVQIVGWIVKGNNRKRMKKLAKV